MKHIYLSPHFDDVVYSCGGTVLNQVQSSAEVFVITVFGGLPLTKELSPLAQGLHTKWQLGWDAAQQRAREDQLALSLLGARGEHWNFNDAIYRQANKEEFCYTTYEQLFNKPHPADEIILDKLTTRLFEELSLYKKDEVILYAPLGIGGHVDHVLIRKAAWRLFEQGFTVFFYEEQPYVSNVPTHLAKVLFPKSGCWWKPLTASILIEPKLQAITCYKSQDKDGQDARKMSSYAGQLAGNGKPAERLWQPIKRRPGIAGLINGFSAYLSWFGVVLNNPALPASTQESSWLKRFIPASARREIRQLWYHSGWLARSARNRNYKSVLKIAQVMALRVIEDMQLLLWGNSQKVSCNLCGWQGNQFYPFTDQNVGLFLDELCPNCGSWARHRSCWHYLQAEIDRLKSRKFKVLEIGPSGGLGKILKSIPQAAYIGIDIQFLPQTDICGDVIRLPFQDNSFDLVICFNVLNAIPNDSSAVAEMGRVCQSGGKVILSDAVDERLAETIEFDCPQAEKHGAVHWYGRDFVERFSKPELNFREDRYTFGLPPDIVQRQGLSRRILFLAEKQAGELACASVLSR